jgi:hypothetical protein
MSDKKPAETPAPSSDNNLPKAYDPSSIEQRWADYWVRERLFEVPTPPTTLGAPHLGVPGQLAGWGEHLDSEMWDSKPFTMLLPPPNVTGYLHMGHMFEHTESDILMRWHRMLGDTALWVPGTDHAGIATQMLVERQLKVEGTDRKTLGREAFTERVWAWKRQYGSAITDQMRRLGASVDWSREYFTMDDRLNVAVREAFVRLYEQGLIYRGAYIVNWDPQIQTAVSDLEVTHEDRTGKLYHIRYPFADGSGSIVVATTRPETMLGDVAVAVNPNDERYQAFIGKLVTLPLSAVSGQDQTAKSPSSPTTGRSPSSAPAPSKSRPPTTPTTSPSASATTCPRLSSSTRPRTSICPARPTTASTASPHASASSPTSKPPACLSPSATTSSPSPSPSAPAPSSSRASRCSGSWPSTRFPQNRVPHISGSPASLLAGVSISLLRCGIRMTRAAEA